MFEKPFLSGTESLIIMTITTSKPQLKQMQKQKCGATYCMLVFLTLKHLPRIFL